MAPLFNLVVCIGSRVWLTCASWRNQRHLAYLVYIRTYSDILPFWCYIRSTSDISLYQNLD